MGRNYAGVDWASEKHDVRRADAAGEELLAATFAHDEAGLRSLCRQLVRHERGAGGDRAPGRGAGRAAAGRGAAGARAASQPGRRGPSALPRLGRQVRPLRRVRAVRARAHRPPSLPRARARQRPDQGAAGAVPRRARISCRRAWRSANQLRAELERFWPGATRIFAELDSPIALAFLERYPSPADARGLGEQAAGRRSSPASTTAAGKHPDELLAKLRSAPEGRAGEAEVQTRRAARARAGRRARSRSSRRSSSSPPDRPAVARAPRRRDLPARCSATPRASSCAADAAGRDRRLPRALPHRRRARRRRRPSRRRDRVRQAQGRLLPLGVQQAPARRVLHARRQHPPLAPLGRRPLRPRDRPRPRPPARDPQPRPRLVPRPLALLARPHPLRPGPPPRPATARHGDDPRIVGPPARPAATQRMLGAAVTRRAARRAEREALDGKPTSAIALGG